jgi:drug/metabolite transporter (DMT)-like permease
MTNQTQAIPISDEKARYTKGVLLALSGAALFSIKPVLIKLAYSVGGDPTSIMTLRAFSSLPIYLVIFALLCRQQRHRNNVRQFGMKAALIGVAGYYCASYLDIVSLQYIPAQLERLLLFLFPSFVILISWLVYGKVPSRVVLTAGLIGYIGIGFIVVHDITAVGPQVLVGSAWAIASAIVFACYLIWSKGLIGVMGSQLFTSIGMGSAGVAIIIHLLVTGAQLDSWGPELIALGIVLGIFCTVIPSYLIAAAMAQLSPTQLSLTSNIGPAITALMAVLILDEAFTVYHVVGMTLVLYSVYRMNKK